MLVVVEQMPDRAGHRFRIGIDEKPVHAVDNRFADPSFGNGDDE